MAEEKKRGRKPKLPEDVKITKNEEKEKLVMSKSQVSFNDVQNKWNEIFVKRGARSFAESPINSGFFQAYLNNPFLQNSRVKQVSSQPSDKTKDDIKALIQSPQGNEQGLRETSALTYYQNYLYNQLVRLQRDIPEYKIYALPTKKRNASDYTKEDLDEADYVNCEIIDKNNLPLEFKTITTQVNIEGKCTYLVRKSWTKDVKIKDRKVNYLKLQKLPSDYVKITGFGSKQYYTVSLNMMIFMMPGWDISFFPPYIGEIWEEMKSNGLIDKDKNGRLSIIPQNLKPLRNSHILEATNNSYAYWVKLDQEDAYTFGQDLAHANAFPETMGMFLDFKDLEDYRWLQSSLISKTVTSILTASIPVKKDSSAGVDATLISPNMIDLYDGIISERVSSTVLPLFAPFEDFDLHTIPNQPENSNIIYNRLRDLIASTGNAALLPITDKPSIAMVKGAQALAAARAHYLTLQYKQFLTNVINEGFGLKNTYKIIIWSDIYDKDRFKLMKEMLLGGYTGLLQPVLSYFDYNITDYQSNCAYLEALGVEVVIKDKTVEETSSQDKKSVGRQPLEEGEVENDNTAASKDAGNNVSDIKMFSLSEERVCIKCNKELEEDENFLCAECFEEELYSRASNVIP